MLKVYCDGACSGNPGPGGWAFVIPKLNIEKSGFEANTTNNRMEITAVVEALKFVYNNFYEGCDGIEIITDSQYVINTMTKGWNKNKNSDLWSMLEYYGWYFRWIEWTWVKGHSTNRHNQRCDELAVNEYKTKTAKIIKDSAEEENSDTLLKTLNLTFTPVCRENSETILYKCEAYNTLYLAITNTGEIIAAGDIDSCKQAAAQKVSK